MVEVVEKTGAVSVLILDSLRLSGLGLACLLKECSDFEIVGNEQCPKRLPDYFNLMKVDVVLMEVAYLKGDPFRFVADWSREYPGVRFFVLAAYPEAVYAERMIRAGASGYLEKTVEPEQLVGAVRRVMSGEVVVSPVIAQRMLSAMSGNRGGQKDVSSGAAALTDRELQVLAYVAQGASTSEIAQLMGIGVKTVDSYKERIKSKLALKNSVQLIQAAGRLLRTVG